ncbi:MAG: ribosome maturation factor RimM [Anaerovoracaceae bacterium]
MGKIEIGKIVNVVGLKGELKVYNYSDQLERFERLEEIYVENDLYQIDKVRYKDHMVILKFKGIDNRDQSEALKGKMLYMKEEDLEELPPGVFYIRDMIGMDVVSDTGEYLGKLSDINTNVPQKLYVVKRENKSDILIPGVDEYILEINMEERKIKVKVIEGLYED